MRNRGVSAIAIGAFAFAAVVPAVALGAAPLPLKAKGFSSGHYSNGVTVSLVTSANGRKIVAGAAPLGANFAVGGIYVQCPTAPRSLSVVPFTNIAFPAMTLKLSHGKYSFSRRLSASQQIGASRLTGRVSLTVQFSGTVISPRLIKGQVKVSGSKCATSASYSARPTGLPVAPGQ